MSAAKNTNSRQHNLADIREDIKSTPCVGRFVSGLSSITKFVRRMVSARAIPVSTGSCGRNNSVAWKPGYWNAKRVFASLALISELITVALYNGSVNFSSLLAIQPAQAASGIAKMVNYQGRLMNASGNAVTDGTYAIKFTIYNSLNNGTQLWSANTANGLPTGTPVAVNVTVKNGLFSVLLGDASAGQVAFPENLFNNDGLYLGVTVGTDSEMKPRKRLSAVPYAYNADALQGQHASATTPSWGGNTFALNQNSTNAATSTRSAFYVHTSGTSNVFDYLIRGNSGTDVFTVNRQGNVTTTGNLEARGYTKLGDATTDRINVQARFVSDLTPATDNTYSLGTASLRWKNLYASYVSTTNVDALGYVSTTNLYVNGNQITGATPSLQQVTNVGATTNKWIKFSGATSIGDFMPSSTNMYSLGSNNYRWKGMWAVGVTSTWIGAGTVSTSKLYINGSEIGGTPSWQQVTDVGKTTTNDIQFAGGTSTGNFVPNTTNSLSLGTSANRWGDIWGATVHVGTSTWNLEQNADQSFAISRHGGTDKLTVSTAGTVSVINPTVSRVSGFDIGGTINSIFVSGKLAYIGTDAEPGLQIYDISNPSNPTLVGSASTGDVKSVYVSGKYLYTGDSGSSDRFSVFDVSNPSAPTLKGSIYYGNNNNNMPYDIKVVGKYAYGAVGGWGKHHFVIIDVSNPSNPTQVSITAMPGAGNSLDVVGKYAYVGDSSANFLIYDVSNPYAPVLKSTTASIGASDIMVRGTTAFIGSWNGSKGLRIYDVADPENPMLKKEYNISNSTVASISLAGDYLYLSTGSLGLAVVNVASTTNPYLVTNYGYNASSNAKVFVSGKYAYWIGANMSPEYTQDMQVLDIGGMDVPVANIGNINGDSLNISYRAILGEAVADSVAVGNGGLWSNGQLGAYGTTTLLGNVGIGTATPTSSKLVVAGGVNPSATNLYSLGSSDYRWLNLWSKNATFTSLYVNGQQIVGGIPDLQEVTDQGYVTNHAIGVAGVSSTGSILPTSNIAYDLGSSNYRWKDVWASSTYIGASTWNLRQGVNGRFVVAQNGGAERLSVLTNGHVGIGTTTADAKLHISGGNILVSGTAQSNGIDTATKLMLHANGTGSSFVDSSPSANTIFAYGDSTQSNTQAKFGGKSAYFDGGGDYLRVNYTSDFDLSGGDFTIDAWFNANSFAANQAIISKDTYGSNFDWTVALVDNNTIGCWTNATFSSLVVDVPVMSTGVWYHVALVRKNGVNTFYLNGVAYGNNSMAFTNANQTALTVGAQGWNNPASFFNGYIDELRVTKGVARWDGDFTPPSTEYSDSVSSGIQVGFDTMPLVYNSLDVNGAFALGDYAGVNGAPSKGFIVSGNVGIGTATPTSSKLVVAGGVNPSATNLYSLGSSDYRWRNLYANTVYANTVYASSSYFNNATTSNLNVGNRVTSDLIANATARNLGSSAARWGSLYLNGNLYATGTIQGSTLRVFGAATTSGNVMPSADSTYSLGNANYRWKNIWGVNATFTSLYVGGLQVTGVTPNLQLVTNAGKTTTNDIQFAGGTSTGSFRPGTNLVYDLGSSSNRWKDVWASSTRIGTSTWELWQSNQGFTISRGFANRYVTVSNSGNMGIGDTSPAALLTVGDGDLFQVNSSGYARGPSGAAGTPTYSFTANSNTGIYRAGANIIGFSTNGSAAAALSYGTLTMYQGSGIGGGISMYDGTGNQVFTIRATTTQMAQAVTLYGPNAYPSGNAFLRVTSGGNMYWDTTTYSSIAGLTNPRIPYFNGSNLADSELSFATGKVYPATNLATDLGDSTHRFKDVWASSTRIGTSTWEIWQSNKGFTVSTSFAKFLTLGKYNILMGNQAGVGLTTGLSNVAIGPAAMAKNATGGYNTAIGDGAMQGPIGGGSSWYNTAIGASTLSRITTGASNTAVGYQSLKNNTTGRNNVAIGLDSQNTNTTGEESVSVGNGSLFTANGSYNTAVGHQTMYTQGGEFNTAMGWKSMRGAGGGSNNTAYGASSLYNINAGENNVAVGLQALSNITNNSENVAIGSFALTSNTASANTAVGSSSLYNNTTGAGNVGMGYYTQYGNQTGKNNTSIGYLSLYGNGASNSYSYNTAIGMASMLSITTGASNTAVGYESLYSNNTGRLNTAVGFQAMRLNQSGYNNEAFGESALYHNVSGSFNVAVGSFALHNNTASNNIAIGSSAMIGNSTGAYNTAVGINSLSQNHVGSYNVALGYEAMDGGTGSSSYNTALGANSLYSITTGATNTAVGYQSLYSNTSGYDNVAIGAEALKANQDGYINTAVGYKALDEATSAYGNIAIGYSAAGRITTGSENMAIGNSSMSWNTTGKHNTAVGHSALAGPFMGGSYWYNTGVGENSLMGLNTGASNTAVGYNSLYMVGTGSMNTALGVNAMSGGYNYQNTAIGYNSLKNNTVAYNTAVGASSLQENTTGQYNTAVGINSLSRNHVGSYNVALGYEAMDGGTGSSSYNTALGASSMHAITTGASNTAVGYRALYSNSTGDSNVALGTYALEANSDGGNNIAIGESSMKLNTTGSSNVAIGVLSLDQNTTGYSNIAIGPSSLDRNTIGNWNVAIGDQALYANVDTDFNIAIGLYALGNVDLTGTGGSGNIGIGMSAGQNNFSGKYLTAIGHEAFNSSNADYNTGVGYQVFQQNITGSSNIGFGYRAGYGNEGGISNIAIGNQSLYSNVEGDANVALGNEALFGTNGGSWNTAVGNYAMNNTGNAANNNTAIGYFANAGLIAQSTGSDNTLVGHYSGYYGMSGSKNTGLGGNALGANTTGASNTAVGYVALPQNTTGYYNTALGAGALYKNANGIRNTALGYLSGYNISSGSNNIAIGESALYNNQSGDNNIAIGNLALKGSALFAPSGVVAIGYNSMVAATAPIGDTAVGYNSQNMVTNGYYNTSLGYRSLGLNTSGDGNTAIGYYALDGDDNGAAAKSYNTGVGYQAGMKLFNGGYNTYMGHQAGMYNETGGYNVAVGSRALYGVSNNSHSGNTAVGYASLEYLTTAGGTVGVGYQAGMNLNSGVNNTAVGYQAMMGGSTNASTVWNTAVGNASLDAITTGDRNTAVGGVSLSALTSGQYNTAMGVDVLASVTTADDNTGVGYLALQATTGAGNTALGRSAGLSNITGTYNTYIGYNANPQASNLTNVTLLGYGAGASGVCGNNNNQVCLGNNLVNKVAAQVTPETYSDGRFKTNVVTSTVGLEFIKKLRPVRYNWIFQPAENVYEGLIAQEVKKAVDEVGEQFTVVDENPNMWGLKYSDFIMPLINSVKTLDVRTDKLAQGIGVDSLFATGTQFLSVSASGTVAMASTEVKAMGIATSTTQGYDSGMFTLQGSGWDTASSTAVTTNFKLYNHTVNATTSELVIGYSSGTSGSVLRTGLTITNLGDVSVSGKLYLGSKKYGVASTSTYMFVDDTLAPTSTYIATNADGWETQTTYDYAERYESIEQLMPGDLVAADPNGVNKVIRATSANQAILGIVSTKPGFVTGGYKPGTFPIALAGRVPTRVSTANGAISVGDYLTVQDGNPGVAVKALGAGNVVGVALESYDKVEEGLISVFVKPSYTMGSLAQSGSQSGVIQTSQTVPTTQRVEIEGLASILAGSTEVHISYGTILAFPMVYGTPHASIDGSWWIANRTDKGFDIILSQAQTHDVDFTWMARPMRAGTVRFVSDNTHQTVDDLTGQPYGPQTSDIVTPTSTSDIPTSGTTSTSDIPTSDSPTSIDTGTSTSSTNTQTQSNSTSTTSS